MSHWMPPKSEIPTGANKALSWRVHHVAFGITLESLADEWGVESHLKHPGAGRPKYTQLENFLIRKLKRDRPNL